MIIKIPLSQLRVRLVLVLIKLKYMTLLGIKRNMFNNIITSDKPDHR